MILKLVATLRMRKPMVQKGKNIVSRSSSSSGSAPDTSALRRSARETSSKKSMAPSPSSTRKSERLENRTPTTPAVMRKSGRVEKQSMSSPLRRSKRGKNQSPSSSFGSKKSGKSLGSSVMKKKHRKEKSVKLLTLEPNEIGHSEKHIIKAVQVETKITDARVYRSLFKQQQKKANLEGFCEETKNEKAKSSQGYCSNLRAGASENVDGGGDCSQREVEELIEECILKDSEKKMLGNSVVGEPVKETLENNFLF